MKKPNFEIKNIHKPQKSLEEKIIVGKCPKCNGDLTLKNGKYGEFSVCSNYPKCKYMENVKKGIVEICDCPCCEGKIIEKKNLSGKVFYACNNYPECKIAFWYKPTGKKCPKCSSLLVMKNNKEICTICDENITDNNIDKLEKYSEHFKQGYREDLQMEFRSSWEANIARLLNYLKIEYTFEKDMYKLNRDNIKYKFSSGVYVPDFILKNGTILEVKGNYDLRSLCNLKLFTELYPNENLKVIDSDIYYLISKKYSDIIKNWEEKASVTSFTIPVVGINIKDRKSFVEKLNIDDALYLERELNNDYDKNAIKVLDEDNNHIGYIPSDYAVIYAPKMDAGIKYTLKLKRKEDKKLEVFIKANNLEEIDITSIIEVF